MKLRNPAFIITTIVALFPAWVHAENLPPRHINLEAVLLDDGGNVIRDKQEEDIIFSILDVTGEVLYQEIQHNVPIINGAISVLVGQGNDANDNPTGGLPYEALDPSTGGKLLRFKLADQTIPQEDVELYSTPYAYYAQYAMQLKDKITSGQVLDGTLAVADLSSEVLDLINQGKSEPTLPIAAKYVSINGSLTYASGSDVQEVVRGFDNTLGVQDRRLKKIEDAFPKLGPGEDLDKRYVNATGDTMTGPLEASSFKGDGSQVTNLNGGNIQPGTVPTNAMVNKNISQWNNDTGYITDGNQGWNNEYGLITDGNDGWDNQYGFITAADIPPPPDLSPYIKRTGDQMDGTLTMSRTDIVMDDTPGCIPGELGLCNKVDGVDVSDLKKDVDDLKKKVVSAKILGWARVNSNGGGVPSFYDQFNFSSISRHPPNYDDCTYKLTFTTPAASAFSYAAMGFLQATKGDNGVVIRETTKDYLILTTEDMGDVGNCNSNEDFHLVVVGN